MIESVDVTIDSTIQGARIWSENLKIILVEPADSDCIYENAKAHILGNSGELKVSS